MKFCRSFAEFCSPCWPRMEAAWAAKVLEVKARTGLYCSQARFQHLENERSRLGWDVGTLFGFQIWEPNPWKHTKTLTRIMEEAGVRGSNLRPSLSLLSVTLGKVQPDWPGIATTVTSRFEILWLCHDLNWHLFPEGIYNPLDDKRWTP